MTVKDLLKRLDTNDLDKVIILSDGEGWTNIGSINIEDNVIVLYEDKEELLSD